MFPGTTIPSVDGKGGKRQDDPSKARYVENSADVFVALCGGTITADQVFDLRHADRFFAKGDFRHLSGHVQRLQKATNAFIRTTANRYPNARFSPEPTCIKRPEIDALVNRAPIKPFLTLRLHHAIMAATQNKIRGVTEITDSGPSTRGGLQPGSIVPSIWVAHPPVLTEVMSRLGGQEGEVIAALRKRRYSGFETLFSEFLLKRPKTHAYAVTKALADAIYAACGEIAAKSSYEMPDFDLVFPTSWDATSAYGVVALSRTDGNMI